MVLSMTMMCFGCMVRPATTPDAFTSISLLKKGVKNIIIHCSIFPYSHWSRAYVEFSVFLSWREYSLVFVTCSRHQRQIRDLFVMCSRHQSYLSCLFECLQQVSATAFARFASVFLHFVF